MRTEMWVITHKKYPGVTDDMYKTLHVGRALSEDLGYQGDDTGDNISAKNKNYCELTGLYWLWKNHDCDIIGICHYRRFFIENERLLTKEYIEKTLENYDIIIMANGAVNCSTVKEHYADRHIGEDLEVCRQIIAEKYPEYSEAFECMQNSKLINFCNMLITRKDIFDKYCAWLFDILFEAEKRIDISGRDDYQKRVFGFLSERLIKVWLLKNQYRVKEQEVKMMDSDEIDKYFKLKRLVRDMLFKISSNILKKYKEGRQNKLAPIKQNVGAGGKTPVWICWLQGEENAPELVKKCIQSVRANLDMQKCELHIITLANCQEYVTFSQTIVDKFNAGKISMTTLSDRLRMELLYRYGGLWIDATYFVNDERINKVFDYEGFFSQKFSAPVWDDDITRGRWAGNFIKGCAGFELFGFVMEAIDEYYVYKDELIEYFMIDYFIDIAYENLEPVRAAIDGCEVNNEDVFFFKNNGNRLFDEEVWNGVVKNTWLFKLYYKQKYTDKNIVGEDTFYGRIVERNNYQM